MLGILVDHSHHLLTERADHLLLLLLQFGLRVFDVKHDWRQELFDELKKRQKDNGSWANSNGAFLENLPSLATAFALLALSYCKKK